MGKKNAVTGFRGMMIAPVTENTLTSYKSAAAENLPFAGTMSRTGKESSTDLYYDDTLYAQVKEVAGEDVEIRIAEMNPAQMAELGLGEYDPTTGILEGDFNVPNKEYSLRFITDTVGRLPYYWNYRVLEMNGIKYDNFNTKKDSTEVCQVIITGVFKRPQMASVAPWARMQLKEDNSNEAACIAFLAAAEERPAP